MEESLFTADQLRILIVSVFSTLLSFYAPTSGLLISLCAMFAFNIFCGMRADGVSIKKCKNFSIKKFIQALRELILYLVIIEVIYTVMTQAGDVDAALIAVKSITYVFMYVYIQNAFKNLVTAYPKNLALRLVYHLVRFEFARAMPSHLQPIIDRLNKELKDEPDKAEKKKTDKKKKDTPEEAQKAEPDKE